MNHRTLRDKIRKAFGGVVPIDARESWADFVRNETSSYFLRYDWIRDPRFYDWIKAQDEIDFYDGTEGIKVFIVTDK